MAKKRPAGDGMIRKRADGRWEGRIVAGHNEDGSPIFRYVTARTQKEAAAKLRHKIEEFKGVELTERSKMTVTEWLDTWYDLYAVPTVRESTAAGYKSMIDNYIKPVIGGFAVSSLTTMDVQKMYSKIKQEGRLRNHPELGHSLSDSSVRNIHMILHQAMDAAVRERMTAKNPTDGCRIPKSNYKEKLILTEAELDVFLNAIEHDPEWYDFYYTEISTGLRRGEICALRWTDLDEKNGTLKIRRSVSNKRNGKLKIGETKTEKGTRTIVLPENTLTVLIQRRKGAYGDWIFPYPTRPEEPMNPSYAYNHLKYLLKKNHLPDIRFHDLRHTFATHALTNAVDPKTLSNILGHTNSSFTLDTYTHVTGDMQVRASEIVEDVLNNILGEELSECQSPERKEPEISA